MDFSRFTDSLLAGIHVVYSYVWEWPTNWTDKSFPFLVVVLLGTGIYATIRLRFVQVRRFKHAWQVISGKYDNPDDAGDINHFQALSAALSATVGIGNIAGVATGIYYGGPGALFWMWITAVFGMTLKYTECTLSLHYRTINPDGSASGGPMYYIEKGLGQNWKWLASLFAVFAVVCSFGTGNGIQAFTVADQFRSEFGFPQYATGLVMCTLVGLVIIGGIRRIGRVASRLTPFMAFFYVTAAVIILISNYEKVPGALRAIVVEAFTPRAEFTGVVGGSFLVFLNTLLWGVKRGLFSNEAGQGSAPIAHAAAKTKESIREGAVAMVGPFIDTLVICSLTGLVIVTTGAHEVLVDGERLNSSPLTTLGFRMGLTWAGQWGGNLVTVAVFLFALSTAISWSYYGDRSAQYLWGDKAIMPYRFIFVGMHFVGAISSLEDIWLFGEVALGLMSFPNLIALILLIPKVKKQQDEYFSRKHLTYKEYVRQRKSAPS